MIKWPITYTDYNGEEHTEDFYFNLSRAEVMEMDLKANGAYAAYIERIVDQRDGDKLAGIFKDIILKSYGEKSPDGRRFVKSEELSTAFSQTEAYSNLYMQLALEPEACQKFIEGVMPKVDASEAPNMENHMKLI